MLEELIYSSLIEGKLPKIPNTKSKFELSVEKFRDKQRLLNNVMNATSVVKVQSTPWKVITITNVGLEGYRTTMRNAYIVKSGDTLTFKATYKYSGIKPEVITLQQSIDDEVRTMYVLFMPKSTYELAVSKTIYDAKNITCKAVTKPRPERPRPYIRDTIRESNDLSVSYPVGVFDDRYKPVSEYPTPNVQNAVLDIAYTWRVQNTIYPTPLPPGLDFTDLRVEFISGFIVYDGKVYKDPATNNTVRIRARIVNNTGANIAVKHWGLPVSVLYEDDKHVSQANVDVSFTTTAITNGTSYAYYLDVNLPSWAYGKVAIAHALNVYKGGMYIYGGGPLYCFEVYRLKLP